MATNIAFTPMTATVNAANTGSVQTISPTYAAGQNLCQYLLSNIGTTTTFFIIGASPVATVANAVPLLAGTSRVFTGPPNAGVQAIGTAGSTLYVTAGEGL
jgi:hypothetical protein